LHINIFPKSKRSKRRAQQLHILRRFLCISIIELGMNLPNYLIRLYLTLVSEEALEQMDRSATFLWAQDISQLLYFAQASSSTAPSDIMQCFAVHSSP
jgi:hypothetical protein